MTSWLAVLVTTPSLVVLAMIKSTVIQMMIAVASLLARMLMFFPAAVAMIWLMAVGVMIS